MTLEALILALDLERQEAGVGDGVRQLGGGRESLDAACRSTGERRGETNKHTYIR